MPINEKEVKWDTPPKDAVVWDDQKPKDRPLLERAALGYKSGMEKVESVPYVGPWIHGFRENVHGATQLLSKPFVSQETTDAYNATWKDSEQKYKDARVANSEDGEPGFDWGRLGGNVVATLPLARVMARTPAATLPGRMKQGAKIGAATAALYPVHDENFWLGKGAQMSMGAVLGTVATPVVEGLTRLSGTLANRILEKARGAANWFKGKNAEEVVREELAGQGINWNDLTQQVRNSLIQDVEQALKQGRNIDPQTLARATEFKNLGVPYLQGQVTRDPALFGREVNLAGMEVGAPVAGVLDKQNRALIGVLDQAKNATGGRATDAYGAGTKLITELDDIATTRQATANSAYERARTAAGGSVEVPLQRVAQTVGEIEQAFGKQNVPPMVRTRLRELGVFGDKQLQSFTVAEADKLKTLINNNWTSLTDAQRKAMGQLVSSIDESLGNIQSPAAESFQLARDLSRYSKSTRGETPALEAAFRKDVAPDDFFKKFVLNGKTDDLTALKRELGSDSPAWADTRFQVVQWLKTKATGGAADETAKFSHKGLNDALNAIGDRRLGILFEPAELAQLKQLARVSGYASVPPVGARPNFSGSAVALLDQLDKLARVPLIGPFVGRPGDILRASQAQQAASGKIPAQRGILMPPEVIDRAAIQAGLLAPPVAVDTAPVASGLLFR